MAASSHLRNLIYYHLDNDLLDTAIFLAGRLHASEPRSPDASHLLALTYLRSRRYKAAYDSSQRHGHGGKHLGCAYVFAQACLQLERHDEGRLALAKAKPFWSEKSNWAKHNDTSRRSLPDAAACLTLLGKLSQACGDTKKAGEYYLAAHKANPMIWEAFESLCKIGADLNVANMFQPPADVNQSESVSATTENTSLTTGLTPSHDPFYGNVLNEQANFLVPAGRTRLHKKQPTLDWETPTTSLMHTDNNSMIMDEEKVPDPPLMRRLREGDQPVFVEPQKKSDVHTLKRTISGRIPPALTIVSDPPSNPRRSNRLFGQGTSAKSSRAAPSADAMAVTAASRIERDARSARPATGAKGRIGSTVGRVVSGNRKLLPPDPAEKDKLKRAPSRIEKVAQIPPAVAVIPAAQRPQVETSPIEHVAIAELLESTKRLAIGVHSAAQFRLSDAVNTYRNLPTSQLETPWILAQLGKAYYEMADYVAAEDCFSRLLTMQPSRIEDMEVYSTVLWHLKRETSLAMLCHMLRDQHYDEPQTWCVIGNTFSLAREHDQAISSFRRATQLDPKFAYAWVLMGHEYIANEEYDAALHAFRKGVASESRGYGGWYGLGKTFEKLAKFEEAERHYRIAASINPSNATLLVCIGVVLEKLNSRKSALLQYTRALHLAPNSALARFKKARVLMHLRSFDVALDELSLLSEQAPDEANVWFLLGKCYKGLGNKGDALRAFTTALNLDAKASPFIREAMEALDEDYDDDADSDDGY